MNSATLRASLTPFGFFAHVLAATRGRAKILARLGPEANDALDEFLNLALDYETRETPSLQGFLNWLRAARSEVRRDMEISRDEVRVMTVHGAKGLEANTVILADTTTPPGGPRDPRLLTLGNGAMVWATARANDADAMLDARSRSQLEARDEYRRLLYVAMTRAAERLVICGTQGARQDSRRLLVSTGRECAGGQMRQRAGRRRRRRGAALSQGRTTAGGGSEEHRAGGDQAHFCNIVAHGQTQRPAPRGRAPSRRRASWTTTTRGRSPPPPTPKPCCAALWCTA